MSITKQREDLTFVDRDNVPKWKLITTTNKQRIINLLKLCFNGRKNSWDHNFHFDVFLFWRHYYTVSWIGFQNQWWNKANQNKIDLIFQKNMFLEIEDVSDNKLIVKSTGIKLLNNEEILVFLENLIETNQIEDFEKYIRFLVRNEVINTEIFDNQEKTNESTDLNNSLNILLYQLLEKWFLDIFLKMFKVLLKNKILSPECMKKIKDFEMWKETRIKIISIIEKIFKKQNKIEKNWYFDIIAQNAWNLNKNQL